VTTYRDKTLTCADCRGKFVWSAREQELYAEKGYSPPARCPGCKQAQRSSLQNKVGKK
jgi:hypothetical protein